MFLRRTWVPYLYPSAVSEDALVETAASRLETIMAQMGRVVVAYSGGVDSALVAMVAHRVLGSGASAVTAVSPSLEARALDDAVSLARRHGWDHHLLDTAEVTRERYRSNLADRCYWCKTELFERLRPYAREREAVLVSGTNADDRHDIRPGERAAREEGVRAPLAEAGLSKAAVRELSVLLGVGGASRPASPCLSSRVAYGLEVTPERLRRIEAGEGLLRSLGFEGCRVRDHGDIVRIEVAEPEGLMARRQELETSFKKLGWTWVTIDLGGFRSGSMNAVLAPPTLTRRKPPDDGRPAG